MKAKVLIGNNEGFTLVELLVSMVIGSILISGAFKIWSATNSGSLLLQTKGDFRNQASLAMAKLNSNILMAGFGMSKMDVVVKSTTTLTDTLTIYSNPTEIRTTLRDTARVGTRRLVVFKDSGFTVGSLLGITDSIRQEYKRIASISGDAVSGFNLNLESDLAYTYLSGVPNVYPIQKQKIFIDSDNHVLIGYVDASRRVLAKDITNFRVSLLDSKGVPAVSFKAIRVVTFNLTGSYKAPAGIPNVMSFSSTVIPRNIL